MADDVVAATLAKLPTGDRSEAIRAMVRVQRLAGLRPQHVSEMRGCDVEQTGEVWRYLPPAAGTKTLHAGRRPVFYFGPRAVAVLKPFLRAAAREDYVFGYIRGGKWQRITRGAYGLAIREACGLAGVAPWTPHQLRHSLATAVVERFRSVEIAADAIGDTPAVAAGVYVHVDPHERARIEVARAMG